MPLWANALTVAASEGLWKPRMTPIPLSLAPANFSQISQAVRSSLSPAATNVQSAVFSLLNDSQLVSPRVFSLAQVSLLFLPRRRLYYPERPTGLLAQPHVFSVVALMKMIVLNVLRLTGHRLESSVGIALSVVEATSLRQHQLDHSSCHIPKPQSKQHRSSQYCSSISHLLCVKTTKIAAISSVVFVALHAPMTSSTLPLIVASIVPSLLTMMILMMRSKSAFVVASPGPDLNSLPPQARRSPTALLAQLLPHQMPPPASTPSSLNMTITPSFGQLQLRQQDSPSASAFAVEAAPNILPEIPFQGDLTAIALHDKERELIRA